MSAAPSTSRRSRSSSAATTARSSRSSGASAARSFASAPGGLRRSSTEPRTSRDGTTRAAPSQARYSAHIEKLVAEHLKDVAAELDRVVRRLQTPKVVIVGSEETRSEFVDALPHEVKSVVVGTTEAEAHSGPNELLEVVQPLLEEAEAADEHEALERWREEIGTNGRGASGWADTLTAASDARVELLLHQEGADQPAHECPHCGRASLEAGECPLDGTPLEPRESGFDLALRQTLLHGGSLLEVRTRSTSGRPPVSARFCGSRSAEPRSRRRRNRSRRGSPGIVRRRARRRPAPAGGRAAPSRAPPDRWLARASPRSGRGAFRPRRTWSGRCRCACQRRRSRP